MIYLVGVDIGSVTTKAVLLNGDNILAHEGHQDARAIDIASWQKVSIQFGGLC